MSFLETGIFQVKIFVGDSPNVCNLLSLEGKKTLEEVLDTAFLEVSSDSFKCEIRKNKIKSSFIYITLE